MDTISTDQIVRLFKGTRLLGEIRNEILRGLAKKSKILSIAKGDNVFKKNDEDSQCGYFVHEGLVGIYRDGFLMANFKPGQIFGEFSLLDGQPHGATARAEEDCTLVCLEREVLFEEMKNQPELSECIIKYLTKRLRRHL